MTICPFCSFENIEGAEDCEECNQPLSDMHLKPATGVEESLLADRVRALKPNVPITVASTSTVGDVLKTLDERSIGCVLVVDDGKLVGIFTERDVLLRVKDLKHSLQEPVAKYMTSDPQTLDESAKVAFAVQRMDLGGYRHVPIVDETGTASGVISVRDILQYLTDLLQPEAAS